MNWQSSDVRYAEADINKQTAKLIYRLLHVAGQSVQCMEDGQMLCLRQDGHQKKLLCSPLSSRVISRTEWQISRWESKFPLMRNGDGTYLTLLAPVLEGNSFNWSTSCSSKKTPRQQVLRLSWLHADFSFRLATVLRLFVLAINHCKCPVSLCKI